MTERIFVALLAGCPVESHFKSGGYNGLLLGFPSVFANKQKEGKTI